MQKKSNKKKVVIGKIYEVKTFTGINVYQKIVGYYKEDPKGDHHYKGVLVLKEDVDRLKSAGVPYKGDENPEDCEGVVFPFQIVREKRKINSKGRKKDERVRNQDNKHRGKGRRNSRRRRGASDEVPTVVLRKRKS
jgi:hypothetical protein